MAGGVFFFLALVDGFIATPLREISSILAHFFLQICSFPVTRQGTILSTRDLTFDVVPACSGSVTLRVMVGIGIYWCGTHPRLSLARKIVGSFLTVPVALLANGIRVALLVGLSYMLNTVITEGVLHSSIGIAGFVLAAVGFYLITESLALDSPTVTRSQHRYVAWCTLVLILGIIYFPFIWKYIPIYNPMEDYGQYDRLGVFLIIAALGTGTFYWRKLPDDARHTRSALIIFIISMLVVFISLRVDITYFLGVSLLLALLAVVYATKGKAFAIAVIPLLVIVYLGYPHVAMQINWLTTKLFSLNTLNSSMLIRFPTAMLLFWVFWTLCKRVTYSSTAVGSPKLFIHTSIALATVVLAFQAYSYSIANKDLGKRLVFSYIQGDWIGHDLPISDSGIEFFGRGNIWSREYVRGNHHVRALINASGGNRHRNHPPEYCLTGNGWKIDQRYESIRQIGLEKSIPVTEMHLVKGEKRKTIVYWFTDGHSEYPDYTAMTVEDTHRRLAGRRTNWFLFRVFTSSDRETLDDFLLSFQFSFETPTNS